MLFLKYIHLIEKNWVLSHLYFILEKQNSPIFSYFSGKV